MALAGWRGWTPRAMSCALRPGLAAPEFRVRSARRASGVGLGRLWGKPSGSTSLVKNAAGAAGLRLDGRDGAARRKQKIAVERTEQASEAQSAQVAIPALLFFRHSRSAIRLSHRLQAVAAQLAAASRQGLRKLAIIPNANGAGHAAANSTSLSVRPLRKSPAVLRSQPPAR